MQCAGAARALSPCCHPGPWRDHPSPSRWRQPRPALGKHLSNAARPTCSLCDVRCKSATVLSKSFTLIHENLIAAVPPTCSLDCSSPSSRAATPAHTASLCTERPPGRLRLNQALPAIIRRTYERGRTLRDSASASNRDTVLLLSEDAFSDFVRSVSNSDLSPAIYLCQRGKPPKNNLACMRSK